MSGTDAMAVRKIEGGKLGKGTWIGFLGVALACAGCCLAPMLGTMAFAGAVASLLALFSNRPVLVALLTVVFSLAVLWTWKSRKKDCCADPTEACSSTGCEIKKNDPMARK